jgi:hypothetical protein
LSLEKEFFYRSLVLGDVNCFCCCKKKTNAAKTDRASAIGTDSQTPLYPNV